MNITFDLETLGLNANSPIVQIGAVLFSGTGAIHDEFQVTINMDSLDEFKFDSDFSTIKWWLNQKKKSQNSVFKTKEEVNLHEALMLFDEWVSQWLSMHEEIMFWSHKDFDPVILNNTYRKLGLHSPIPYKKQMDIRTLTFFAGDLKIKREGIHHNALDDCRHQAKYITKGIKQINRNKVRSK